MLPLATTMAGMAMTLGPTDVCKTPVGPAIVPTPYPNIAMTTPTINCPMFIFVNKKQPITLASQIPVSTGDEPGVAGGVVSSLIKGPARFTMGSALVYMNAMPAVRLTSTTTQNGMAPNTVGMVTVPSQPLVTLMS